MRSAVRVGNAWQRRRAGSPLTRGPNRTGADGFPDDADLTSTFEPGAHNAAYWRRMLPEQLEFLGTRP